MTADASNAGLPRAIGYQAGTSSQRPDSLRDAAEQFEAKFIKMMLQSMRSASPDSDSPLSQDAGMYQDLFDRRIAQEVAGQEKLGLSEMLVRQLGDGDSTAAASAAESTPPKRPAPDGVPASSSPSDIPSMELPVPSDDTQAPTSSEAERMTSSPEAFVEALRPHARAAGKALGVDPQVLIAQAALETDWGGQMIRHDDGQPTMNVFNIKAGEGEPAASRMTTEYIDGRPAQRQAAFRSYDSLQAAFQDYVALVQESPRYAQARQANDSSGYLRGLQAGGFATDPEYAEKVERVLGSERLDASRVSLQANRGAQ